MQYLCSCIASQSIMRRSIRISSSDTVKEVLVILLKIIPEIAVVLLPLQGTGDALKRGGIILLSQFDFEDRKSVHSTRQIRYMIRKGDI